jgi:hypothetical protein
VAAAVSLPTSLAEAALVSAMRYASSPASIGAVSAPVAALTEGFLGTTMMMTKLKVIAAVVTLGLVATSVGALAQSGPGPYQPPTQGGDDRLREVEQKLDRVLSALEGLARPATTYTVAEPKRAEPGAQTKSAGPFYRTEPGYTVSAPFKPDGYVTNPATGPVKQPDMANAFPRGPSPGVEQRLAELERRLTKLEKHVYDGTGSDTPRGKGAYIETDAPATKTADVPQKR